MRRPLASPPAPVLALVAVLGLVPGCKSMGGVMSGLGKAAAGAASGVAHAAPAVARGVAQAGGAVARGVARTAPTVLRATEAVVETAADVAWSMPDDAIVVGAEVAVPASADPGDPCQACPLDDDCGACAGHAGYACAASPAGAFARCESSAPPDAPPAPAPPATAPSAPPTAAPTSLPPTLPPVVPPAPPAPGASWFRFRF